MQLEILAFLQYLLIGTPWNFERYGPFWLLIFLPLRKGSSQTSVKLWPHEEAQRFEWSALIPSSIMAWNVELGRLEFLDYQVIWDILEAGFFLSRFPYQ